MIEGERLGPGSLDPAQASAQNRNERFDRSRSFSNERSIDLPITRVPYPTRASTMHVCPLRAARHDQRVFA